MEIQRSYIHSSTSSGHYAGGASIHNSALTSLVGKEQHIPHLSNQEPINTPLPQQLSITSPRSIIRNDNLDTLPKQDGSMTLDESKPTTNATTTYSPAMYLATRDKRKSSPAVLGLLRLGEEQEAKLSLHRNSIEAAMLLVNFTRPQTKPSSPILENKETTGWKDTMSVGSNPDKKTTSLWQDMTPPPASIRQRRHSFDGKMTWESMPAQFLNQASLLHELKVKPIKMIPSSTTTSSSSAISSPRIRSKTWYSESMEQDHKQHPLNDRPPIVYHATNQQLLSNDQSIMQQSYPQPPPPPTGYYPYPYPQHYYFPNKLPLATSSSTNATEDNNNSNNGMFMMHAYHAYHAYSPMVPPPPHLHPLHPIQQQQHQHPYAFQHLQQQSQAMSAAAMAAPAVKPKRKRRDQAEDEESADQVMPGDPDFPDMAERDVEAARNDVEARPRRQKLRYLGDMYTPQWVRYNGQSKEGLCDTCKPGKWLQLKNSAFWYHKQFFHGISSVSGTEFMKPMDTRWVDQDIVEGLCHQCQQWVSVSNVKRKNSVLWYRHAHKCHVYHKPKNGSPKRT